MDDIGGCGADFGGFCADFGGVGADFGGEGNGGVILKEAHLGRDSLVGVAMILNRMSQDKKPISEIHSSLPQFYIVKDKIDLDNIDLNVVLDKAKSVFGDAKIDTLDGIKFIWDDRWIHLRSSNILTPGWISSTRVCDTCV